MVRILLEHDADPACASPTPIQPAIMGRHEAVVQLLITRAIDPNHQNYSSSTRTLLALAVEHSSKEVIETLLQHNADPAQGDLLVYAIGYKGSKVIADILLAWKYKRQ